MEITDTNSPKEFLIAAISLVTNKFPIRKRLAVTRYMKTYIYRMSGYEIAETIERIKAGRRTDLDYKLEQASKGYDKWMIKHGRQEEEEPGFRPTPYDVERLKQIIAKEKKEPQR